MVGRQKPRKESSSQLMLLSLILVAGSWCVGLDPIQIGTCTGVHRWSTWDTFIKHVLWAPRRHTGDDDLSRSDVEVEWSTTVTLKSQQNVAITMQ